MKFDCQNKRKIDEKEKKHKQRYLEKKEIEKKVEKRKGGEKGEERERERGQFCLNGAEAWIIMCNLLILRFTCFKVLSKFLKFSAMLQFLDFHFFHLLNSLLGIQQKRRDGPFFWQS
jgi:hypothetical protein